MKFLISHRGNIEGPDAQFENMPQYIDFARSKGYQVEIDVWYDSEYHLGHDRPDYKISKDWLLERKDWLWCHAKNLEALQHLIQDGMHCFWHQEDQATLTSKNIIWCYPGNFIKNGIAVMPENVMSESEIKKMIGKVLGVCTDYPSKFALEDYNTT